ncbi:MAG: plastocyanin/azurin family copper-binding protein [Phycisphaerales bacterium]
MRTLALASSLALATPALADATFYLHDYTFSTDPDPQATAPNTVTIAPGETVRWIWVANFHSVFQVDGPNLDNPFHSVLSATPGFTFEHTFTDPGVYTFICEIHGSHPMPGHAQGMWGSVTVTPAPSALAAAPLLVLTAARRRR